jgi:hypothetical protein
MADRLRELYNFIASQATLYTPDWNVVLAHMALSTIYAALKSFPNIHFTDIRTLALEFSSALM